MRVFVLKPFLRLFGAILLLFLFVVPGVNGAHGQGTSPKSPSDTVREFYKAMREKRYHDALSISIYKPAIINLTPAEFEDLKPDFDRLAATMPPSITIKGEQISGDDATVFVKVPEGDSSDPPEPVACIRREGIWIVGDVTNEQIVLKSGKKFFFDARLEAHQGDAQSMLQRIGIAQLAYSQQHAGMFGTLESLMESGLVPKDLATPDSTGYRFHVNIFNGGKAYSASAEPAQYGRTGKLSFYMDSGGMKSADLGGKPLTASTK